jgi:hypothetical protein
MPGRLDWAPMPGIEAPCLRVTCRHNGRTVGGSNPICPSPCGALTIPLRQNFDLLFFVSQTQTKSDVLPCHLA